MAKAAGEGAKKTQKSADSSIKKNGSSKSGSNGKNQTTTTYLRGSSNGGTSAKDSSDHVCSEHEVAHDRQSFPQDREVDTKALQEKDNNLRKLESDLNSREVNLIEREIKSLRVQEELDRLRPLSGLYRVVKAMATERRLDSLLDVITRETQMMLKCDRCSVFVLEATKGELWTQVAQGLVGHRTI